MLLTCGTRLTAIGSSAPFMARLLQLIKGGDSEETHVFLSANGGEDSAAVSQVSQQEGARGPGADNPEGKVGILEASAQKKPTNFHYFFMH